MKFINKEETPLVPVTVTVYVNDNSVLAKARAYATSLRWEAFKTDAYTEFGHSVSKNLWADSSPSSTRPRTARWSPSSRSS